MKQCSILCILLVCCLVLLSLTVNFCQFPVIVYCATPTLDDIIESHNHQHPNSRVKPQPGLGLSSCLEHFTHVLGLNYPHDNVRSIPVRVWGIMSYLSSITVVGLIHLAIGGRGVVYENALAGSILRSGPKTNHLVIVPDSYIVGLA